MTILLQIHVLLCYSACVVICVDDVYGAVGTDVVVGCDHKQYTIETVTWYKIRRGVALPIYRLVV